jgi:uncharacterized protein YndB with AHSA1/START domain
VGDGDVSGHRRWEEDGLVILEDPRYGRFPIRVEYLEPQRYASFRWASGFPGEAPTEGNSTLVEFWLAEQDGGTLLRARESGFDSLAVDSTVRDDTVTGNTKGWMQQLGFLRVRAERVVA